MAAVRESREAQISAIAALDEPTRRRLYDYVVRQAVAASASRPSWCSRSARAACSRW